MNSRRFHRSIMTVAAPLLLYWVLSGLTIALVDVLDPHQSWASLGGGPGARLEDGAHAAPAVPAPESEAGIAKTLAGFADMPVAAVDYRMTGDIARLELSTASGDRGAERRFYAASGDSMTPLVADGDPFRPPPVYEARRDRIKSFHKGDAFGLLGQFVGLIAGCAVIAMTVSGVLVYLQLWRARRRMRKPAVFWRSRESLWRSLHRSLAIVAAVFVLNKAVTGTILAWGEIQIQLAAVYHVMPFPYPMPTPLPPVSEGRLSGDLAKALQRMYEAASATHPEAPVVAIELVKREGQSKGIVTLGGGHPMTLAFDMASAAPTSDWATSGTQHGNGYFADWHQVLKRMHRGDILGVFAGRYVDIAVGTALLYLVASGLVLYVQMYQRRLRAGQQGLFWN